VKPVPTYELYGESVPQFALDILHCESIPQRAQLYDWEIQPHRHDLFVQILHVHSGSTDVLFDDRSFRIDAPCVLFLPVLTVHGFRFSRDVDGTVITINARQFESLLASIPVIQPVFRSPMCLRLEEASSQDAQIAGHFGQLVAEFHGNAPYRIAAIEAALMMILVQIARGLCATEDVVAGSPPRRLQHAQGFSSAVDVYYRQQRDLNFYADHLGITPTQLNRVCRQVMGKSALGVINSRLLVEAKRDLAYSSLSVKEIALTLGFSESAYFSRFFTKHTGVSPMAFREVIRRQLAGK
jgi:AraC family transcriptional regulator, transcriptional activator of pobA